MNYLRTAAPKPSVFLDCNGDRAVPFPGCKEVFISDSLLFEVTFRMLHLNEWDSIRASVIALMRRFSHADLAGRVLELSRSDFASHPTGTPRGADARGAGGYTGASAN